MSFRFNIDLSFDFPRPPPRDDTHTASPDQDANPPQSKKGWPGWLQTARQHPHYSLRLLYSLACIMGLILETVVLNNVWGSYDIRDIHSTAIWLVSHTMPLSTLTLKSSNHEPARIGVVN